MSSEPTSEELLEAKYVLYHGGFRSALYVDGKYHDLAKSDEVGEMLSLLLGVVHVESDAFLLGEEDFENVAETVAEAEAYRTGKVASDAPAKLRAAALRARAQKLLTEAEELDGEG